MMGRGLSSKERNCDTGEKKTWICSVEVVLTTANLVVGEADGLGSRRAF